jgi:hypothetical protein
MSCNSTVRDHLLMVDWGHGICLRAHVKWVCKALGLKKSSQLPRLGGFATNVFTVS